MFRQKKSHHAVKQGLKRLYPRLWRFCLVTTGKQDWADDLAQTTCLKALERADQFQPGSRIDSWIFTIAQRSWIDELRKQAVRTGGGLAPLEEFELPDIKNDPEANLIVRETLLQVMELPEAQRTTVMLVYGEGYSYKETAEILGIPIGTIMSRLAAARAKLAQKSDEQSKTA